MTGELFGQDDPPQTARLALAEGALLLRGHAVASQDRLLAAIEQVALAAPFRNMVTPGGRAMSVAMTNCGCAGWVTDRRGYRYDPLDPETGRPWPEMPGCFADLATDAARDAGYPGFRPDACLINRYAPGARMGLHQDRDERDLAQPIVSVSLGLPAMFQFGGRRRNDPVAKYPLLHGDVLVWGGPSRLNHHGILTLRDGVHPKTGALRLNLTFRHAL
ncbi:alkylated DNA repair protein (DNA oxidative demethylase) [Paracoccus halophilus]|uniref:Alkylated DNA repair protein (DNA oxidative demethylase) n=1 Tax=Paracoccus halophilus TaxID=376733 RepID=A0A099F806_9RHOB|nr:DNA oxidative demethylase AlkB [Paracoccus halophilus]KGJ06252.1 alpha-ketoglutarate-dependent dioxygenase [Paracoccus halophilus]SFA45472.1 alkylated DNA repair protein (DNA oxidative demethylase) [Paracoccus halophilus]